MEFLDVINPDGTSAGYSLSRKEVHRKGLWHRTVHIWILNSNNELLLQKRSLNKDVYPGFWDISCAGHLSAGDNNLSGAIRELNEELGLIIDCSELEFLFTVNQYYRKDDDSFVDNELTDVFLLRKDIEIFLLVIDKNEVSDIRYVSVKELQNIFLSDSDYLAPHPEEYRLLFDRLLKKSEIR